MRVGITFFFTIRSYRIDFNLNYQILLQLNKVQCSLRVITVQSRIVESVPNGRCKLKRENLVSNKIYIILHVSKYLVQIFRKYFFLFKIYDIFHFKKIKKCMTKSRDFFQKRSFFYIIFEKIAFLVEIL